MTSLQSLTRNKPGLDDCSWTAARTDMEDLRGIARHGDLPDLLALAAAGGLALRMRTYPLDAVLDAIG